MLAVLVDFETPVLEGMEGVCGKEDKEVRKREFLLAGLVSPLRWTPFPVLNSPVDK